MLLKLLTSTGNNSNPNSVDARIGFPLWIAPLFEARYFKKIDCNSMNIRHFELWRVRY